MTIDEIKQAIHKADLQIRPNIIFVNPLDVEAIKEALPEIENAMVIHETEAIESGKAAVINRETYEKWANNDFGYTWSELE